MAERYGYKTIKDALVTLLGTTSVSDLNSGLARSVQQVITLKPDNIVIPDPKFPTVCVWLESATETFRGASTRKESTAIYKIDFWTKAIGSLDSAIDESQLLGDNILYIIASKINITNLGSSRGWIKATEMRFDYNTDQSGFIAHGNIRLEVN